MVAGPFFLGRCVADCMSIWEKGNLTSSCMVTQKSQSNLFGDFVHFLLSFFLSYTFFFLLALNNF